MSIFAYPIREISLSDKDFPGRLKKIKNPPRKLYVRGNPDVLTSKTLAIVGSRRMTHYGETVIARLLPDIVSERVVTISGFMYGVDSEVHAQTVALGGQTIAVFGCGLDVVYPPENISLYEDILKTKGLVVSEYEPKARPHLWKFPQRNRIVVGLSTIGVLIIEAADKSGSLVTARLAHKEGRRVYAVPGAITSSVSGGTNELIKKGKARLVTCSLDILGSARPKTQKQTPPADLSGNELRLWQILGQEALSLDEIAYELKDSVSNVSIAITNLSLKGLIRESAGKYYLV